MQVISIIILCLLAAAAKAVADAQAHGSPRLLAWLPRWAATDSWRNKYRGNDPALGPRFPGSTTWLVAFTDLWHLANLVAWAAWAATAVLACLAGRPGLWWLVGGLVAGKLVFEPFYAFLRKQP